MPYEVFDRKVKPRGTAAITITKYGQLSFNKKSVDILKNKKIKYVYMLWDKDKRSIGIMAVDEDDERSFAIRWSSRGDGAGFSVASFLRHIEYNANESRVFPVQWDDKQKLFEFSIEEDHYIKGGYVTSFRKNTADD